ncbi:DUF2785 domain-containing protein [Undibacterium sp. TJN19]|uniref:DUF2785 domain-containing protein n=1 Tax=Undibacterium sp. TJN19 TaxID=3413055 RepID=UPI003BF464ED
MHHKMFSPALLLMITLGVSGPIHATCQPDNQIRTDMLAIKAANWVVEDDVKRQALAISLADCLGHPDPVLRDELAFDGLSAWMRGEKLQVATLTVLRKKILADLQENREDEHGFLRPFAILTLAELVRVDRRQPYLSSQERIDIVNVGSNYLTQLQDYRGFDEKDGWRHGIAHSADLMLQLALNPAIEKPQHETMLAAIASQVAPASHFYKYGEGTRLMTAIFYLAKTPSFNNRDWENWFNQLMEQHSKPGPYTQARLAQRHNLSGFLLPLYYSVRESTDATLKERLLPAIREALKKVN